MRLFLGKRFRAPVIGSVIAGASVPFHPSRIFPAYGVQTIPVFVIGLLGSIAVWLIWLVSRN